VRKTESSTRRAPCSPDPLNYDVVVPLGARWAVYDERLQETWVADEMGAGAGR